MIRRFLARRGLPVTALAAGAAAAALAVSHAPVPAAAAPDPAAAGHQIATLPGYHASVFAKGTNQYSRPDSVVSAAGRVFVGYQNDTAPNDLTKTSTVVEYSSAGKLLKKWSLIGRNDGLRYDPYTHQLWATVNEDGNSSLYTIDPTGGQVKHYTWSAAPHGGGYDDLAFAGGMAFVAASNPTLDANGVNTSAAVSKVVLAGTTATVTPVLLGNASAVDATTHTSVTLNLTDPDSMSIDSAGDVALVDQADSEIVVLHGAGTPQQTVTRLPVGTQLDDTVWAPSGKSRLLVADTSHNAIYDISGAFAPGTVYGEAPNGSGVGGFVGTVDQSTGNLTPVAIGFGSPSGLVFAPASDSSDQG